MARSRNQGRRGKKRRRNDRGGYRPRKRQRTENNLTPEKIKENWEIVKEKLIASVRDDNDDLLARPSVTEVHLGIELYVNSDTPHVDVILKNRHHDFIVNEIDLQGNVVRITDSDPLPEDVAEIERMKNKDYVVSDELRETLGSHFNEEVISNFSTFINKIEEIQAKIVTIQEEIDIIKFSSDSKNEDDDDEKEKDEKDAEEKNDDDGSSSQRRELVGQIKEKQKELNELRFDFPGTSDKDVRSEVHGALNDHVPLLSHKTGSGGTIVCTFSRKVEKRWTKGENQHLRCIVSHTGKGTFQTVNMLCKFLRVKDVGYCGTKDQHGCSSQWMSFYRKLSTDLTRVASKINQIQVGNFEYSKEKCRLGGLTGNQFTITLRNVPHDVDREALENALESCKTKGFVNYFGLQRFGTRNVSTYEVGRAILKKKYDLAAALVILPKAGEPDHVREVKDKMMADGQTKELPHFMLNEKRLIDTLTRNDSSEERLFEKAFESLPRNVKTLYVHSYQSWIWNRAVTERLKRHGDNPVIGDLVLVQDDDEEDAPMRLPIDWVTEDNIDEYTIFDVVLPLLGPSIKLPQNDIRDFMEGLLAEDKLSMDELAKPSILGLWNSRGDYRAIMAKPLEMSWEFKKYDRPDLSLVGTDFDEGNGEVEDGEFLACVVSVSLKKSTYATICLREVFKDAFREEKTHPAGKAMEVDGN